MLHAGLLVWKEYDMTVEQAVQLRRSVRKFTSEPIKQADLDKIVEAGTVAPLAAGDYPTTHITVVQDHELIEAIRAASHVESIKHPGVILDSLHGANTLILVSVSDISDDHIEYCNVATVVENMMLQATELNLGSCYIWSAIRIFQKDESIMSKLKLPENSVILSGLVVGYAEKPLYVRENREKISVTTI